MDYKIRNVPAALDQNLIIRAKELASNKEATKSNSLTDKELNQLLSSALKNDSLISEEELKFIAGLTNEDNVKKLKRNNFNPVNGELSFNLVQPDKMQSLRNEANKLILSSKASPVEKKLKTDQNLIPLFNTLNDSSLTVKDRQNIIERYRDQAGENINAFKIIAENDFFRSGLFEGVAIIGGGKPGITDYLASEVKKQPLNGIFNRLSDFVIENKGTKNPQEIFNYALSVSKETYPHNPKEAKRIALMAMATMVNETHNGKFSVNNKEQELKGDLKAAYIAFNDHKASVVMNHNVTPLPNREGLTPGPDFTGDNNLHFWSHSFITYELLDRGYSKQEASDFSAYVGAFKEANETHEYKGNAGIKDIIINAYGAEFGIQMFEKDNIPVPPKFEGPQVENRNI